MILNNKRILITGGTGSLGKTLVNRLLKERHGKPKKIIIFSRDEAKQQEMRVSYMHRAVATDEIIYNNFRELIEFQIGDIRDYARISSVLQDVDIVFNAAALKQVPTCEYFPFEAVLTNICGAYNIVRAIREHNLKVETVVGISTDKACKPINLMGMTKAIQERIFIQANILCPNTRFIVVRYGNVLASRGSVIPLFRSQILEGGAVTITTKDMTRFLITLEDSVDLIMAALRDARPGEIYIPKIPSAKIIDVAKILIGNRKTKIKVMGIRPGEKIHEILISAEECDRVVERGKYYVICPMLPELNKRYKHKLVLKNEYSSANNIMSKKQLFDLLKKHNFLIEDAVEDKEELLK
jgi:UDP-glucose 4-epimerase